MTRVLVVAAFMFLQAGEPAGPCRNYDAPKETSTGCACVMICDYDDNGKPRQHEDAQAGEPGHAPKCQHWCNPKQCQCHSPKCE